MTIDLTSIANAVIALIAAIITAFVIPWIRSKTTAAQFEKIKMWVTVAVEAAVFSLPDYFTISGIPADTDSNKE